MLCFRQSLSPSLYIKRLRCVDCGTSQTFYYTFGVTHCHIVYHYLYLVSTNIPSFPHLGQFNGDHTQFGLSPVEQIMCNHRNPSLLHESLITASNNNSKFILYISIEVQTISLLYILLPNIQYPPFRLFTYSTHFFT